MTNPSSLLYLNRKKLVIKDLEYIIYLQSKEEYINNSNRELDEIEEYIGMILVAANNDKNILEECENYIQYKYKANLLETSASISAYEYCLELLKNAKIRTGLVSSVPPSLDRITINPKKMNGQPCIRDLRLTVWRVIELLQTYPDRSELYQEFPELTEEDIKQAVIYNDLNSKDPVKASVVTNSIAHETFA
ncbi:hypothetical protein Cha6605_0226 [Chamaesiphon minutus PCC 6605]|uniref:DUF433 domain-containing protein n=1 Tax=Chamaesiphon minutus (strain ATCC 27169 / PCC 6605) TaxID=1173020 RepID=K9UA79_CHAP6|nr:hypothetical protein Cha6605_0226 [Chamaesiphon minutus PCC 6605]